MKKQQWLGKINRARYIERNICSWIKRHKDPNAKVVEKFNVERDIYSNVLGDVEVKEDRMAHTTGNYAIEFEDGHGKPSGIAATQAKQFVIVDWEHVCFIATETLKYLIKEIPDVRTIEMGFKFDDGTKSKGWLVPREKILTSPYVQVLDRWFPVLGEHDVRT